MAGPVNRAVAPATGVILVICFWLANHRLPSAPTVMPRGSVTGDATTVAARPAVLLRPMEDWLVNHRLPSGAATIPRTSTVAAFDTTPCSRPFVDIQPIALELPNQSLPSGPAVTPPCPSVPA